MSLSEKPAQQPNTQFSGSCACKRITYDCSAFPPKASACHCVTCRKLSGGPYQAFTDVDAKSVTFYDNKEKLKYEGLPKDTIGGITFLRFSKVGERAFCADCHTPLAMRYLQSPHEVGLALGAVDDESLATSEVKDGLELKSHIFVSQKASWVEIKDGLPTYDRFNGDFEDRLQAWEGKESGEDVELR